MPGLVVYAAPSPFRRRARLLWSYGAAGAEAEYAAAALLDEAVADNRGVFLVEDYYSVWPQVGALPGAKSYEELLEALEAYLSRSCGARLPTRLCGRTRWRAVPGYAEMGGWLFEAGEGDTLLAAAAAVLEEALALGRRLDTLYLVLDAEADTWTARSAELAAAAASALLGARLELVRAPREPYPRPRRGAARLLPGGGMGPGDALRLLLRLASPGAVLRRRAPWAPEPVQPRELLYTEAAGSMASRCWLAAVAAAACAAPPGAAERLLGLLEELLRSYIESTRLSKKRVGGMAVHGLEAATGPLLALLAGAAVEARAEQLLGRQGCEEALRRGVERVVIDRLAAETGCPGDATPGACLEASDDRVKLREGCLKKLRKAALGQETQR